MVGLNFAATFLNPDGRPDPETGWDPLLRHLDYLMARLGEDHVGFGSDFDGAVIPTFLKDAAGLPGLIDELRRRGYGDALLRKLGHENWLAVLDRTWGE
jgi:membrane dipeptidase